mmetsp:Transcript_13347/g.35631  ORF Transcript_13347/g.35631 Transcript_13347/m.35631 type:complete len:201 (+) Transcript_13347:188-790(+)
MDPQDVQRPAAPLSKSAKKNLARKAKKQAEGDAAPSTDEPAAQAQQASGAGNAEPISGGAGAGVSALADQPANALSDAERAAMTQRLREEVGRQADALKAQLRDVDASPAGEAKHAELASQLEYLGAFQGAGGDSDPSKKLKACRKKMRQIADLEAKSSATGTALNEEQRAKLASKPALDAEIGKLVALLAAAGVEDATS